MNTRYLTGTLLTVLGGIVVVTSRAMAPSTVSWIAFAVAIAAVAITLLAQLDSSRPAVQRVLDAATIVVEVLSVIFALTASGATTAWLCFAFGLGFALLGYTGLTLNEIGSWRAAHSLDQLHWLPQDRPVTGRIDRTAA
jgi:hypothetical protein